MKNDTQSKPAILARIRANKPPAVALPDIPEFSPAETGLMARFRKTLEAVGSTLIERKAGQPLAQLLSEQLALQPVVASTVPGLSGNVRLEDIRDPVSLENVGLAVLPARIGVAENGAVWITEEDCRHRVLPFITQHLVVVLNRKHLVENMHQAYGKIQVDSTGFGLFIAGPSKTADIEQSLVIGAQGPRSFTVILE